MSTTLSKPNVTLTWQYHDPIMVQGPLLGINRAMRRIKDGFLGSGTWTNKSGSGITPTGAWTVDYSCDKTTAGTKGDLVDRWTDDSKVNWGNIGAAHSWIVLKNILLPGNSVELCIDLTASSTQATFVLSPSAGFTGGTTLNRPTATDEIIFQTSSSWGIDFQPSVAHLMLATTGEIRLFLYNGGSTGQAVFLLIIDSLQEHADNIAGPVAGFSVSHNGGNIYGQLSGTARNTHITTGGTVCSSWVASYGSAGVTGALVAGDSTGSAGVPSDYDGDDQFFSCAIWSNTYLGRGHAGTFKDFWLSHTDMMHLYGMSYPNDTSHSFVSVGGYILPWNTKALVTF